jgi:hypothetical protein
VTAPDSLRSVLVAGLVFGLALVVGVDVPHCLLLALAAVALLQLRRVSGTEDDGWPDREDERSDAGARREVARLSWGLSGFESRVDRRTLAMLQATAARRLLRHGVDLDDPASADRARRLLGDHAYATLTSGPDSLPRFDSFTRAVSAVEQLTERPPG